MALSIEQLDSAMSRKRTIQHKKGGIYVILGMTEAKHEGAWVNGYSYMDVKTKKSYWRDAFDFKNFVVREK